MPLSLLLIDAHEALRDGLSTLLERAGDRDCPVVLYAGDPSAVVAELALVGAVHGVAIRGGGAPELLAGRAGTLAPMIAAGSRDVDAPAPARLSILSKRESEVMELLSQGLNGEQIAARLVLSGQTVKTHVRNAMVKLQATTRVHAIAIAIREGHITGPGLAPVSSAPQAHPLAVLAPAP